MYSQILALMCLWAALLTSSAWAVPPQAKSSSDSFNYTLDTLRESVEKLSLENQSLAQENDKRRAQLKAMSDQLRALQKDEARILEQFSSLEGRYQKKLEQSKAVEDRTRSLKNSIAAAQKEYARVLEEVAAKERADMELQGQSAILQQELTDIRGQRMEKMLAEGEAPQLRAEGEALAKELAQAEASLKATREQWLEAQELYEAGGAQSGQLKTNLKDRQDFLAAHEGSLPALREKVVQEEKALRESSSRTVTENDNAKLDAEVRQLNVQYQKFSQELAKAQKNEAEKDRRALLQREDQEKKYAKLQKEAEYRNKALRAELDSLRRQMVELDKKKAKLEQVVYAGQ